MTWARMVELLRVKLTQDEVVRKSAELARHLAESAQRREDQRALQRRFTEESKERERYEQELASDIVNGTEERPVECFEEPRFADLLVDIVRADTHEVIRTRAMQPGERQTGLRFVADSDDEEDDASDPDPYAN